MKKTNYFITLLCITAFLSTNRTNAQSLSNNELGDIYAENIKWSAFPAFPPEARLAVLIGDPKKVAPYVVR